MSDDDVKRGGDRNVWGGGGCGMCEGEGGSEPAVRSSIPLALHLTPRASPYGKRKSDMVLREQAPGNHI